MANNPPAPDLGAQDPRLAELYRSLARCVGTYQSVTFTPQDAAAWLQHVDAQAAWLQHVVAERDAAVRERDQARAFNRTWQEVQYANNDTINELAARCHAAEARTTPPGET